MDAIDRHRRHGDTRLGRAIEEARRWVMVILIVLVAALGWQGSRLTHQVSTLKTSVDRIELSSTRTEAAADELVAFVHEIEAQQQQTSGQSQKDVVAKIVALLCASSDPARVKACADLTQPGG